MSGVLQPERWSMPCGGDTPGPVITGDIVCKTVSRQIVFRRLSKEVENMFKKGVSLETHPERFKGQLSFRHSPANHIFLVQNEDHVVHVTGCYVNSTWYLSLAMVSIIL